MDRREAAGAADVRRWRQEPDSLSRLPLGAFDDAPVTEVVLRRVLLATRVPPRLARLLSGRRGFRAAVDSCAYWRGVRRSVDRDTWRRLTGGTTILMYHGFSADEPPSRFVVSRRAFERQMRWIVGRRPVLALDELVELRREHRLPPAGAVVVTIDDGYDDARAVAQPVLSANGVPATLFVVTRLMGGTNEWETRAPLAGRPLLSWRAALELERSGTSLGGHSRTHPVLRDLPATALESETAGAQQDLVEARGAPAVAFAYPYGRSNDTVASAVERAGFECAVTAAAGRNSPSTPLYALRRTEVRGDRSFLRFVLSIRFGDAQVGATLLRRVLGR